MLKTSNNDIDSDYCCNVILYSRMADKLSRGSNSVSKNGSIVVRKADLMSVLSIQVIDTCKTVCYQLIVFGHLP